MWHYYSCQKIISYTDQCNFVFPQQEYHLQITLVYYIHTVKITPIFLISEVSFCLPRVLNVSVSVVFPHFVTVSLCKYIPIQQTKNRQIHSPKLKPHNLLFYTITTTKATTSPQCACLSRPLQGGKCRLGGWAVCLSPGQGRDCATISLGWCTSWSAVEFSLLLEKKGYIGFHIMNCWLITHLSSNGCNK